MNIELHIRVSEVMTEYNGNKLDYGKLDCNLMFLKAFEPEKFEQFVGTYKTVRGGAIKASKLFGFNRIEDYMEQSTDYEQIDPIYIQFGDIIVGNPDTGRECLISMGHKKAFGVLPKGKVFGHCEIKLPPTYKIYRRV